MKNKFKYLGVLILICFSFYYTDQASNIIKNNDPIMKEIKKVSNKYITESVNAEINNNTITPGISGKKIDIDKTYESMKKYGSFNIDLISYKKTEPTVSINNTYDKYIRKGNKKNKSISLVFIIRDYNNIEEIINILNSKNINATFFISNSIINESVDLVKLIYNSGNEIEFYSVNYDNSNIGNFKYKVDYIIKSKVNFCITTKEDENILKACSKNKMHTIIPSIITSNFPYSDIKNNIENGSIMLLSTNDELVRELKYILNYINQKGYKFVKLNKLIEE